MPELNLMIKPMSGQCQMNCTYCFYRDELVYRAEKCLHRMSDEVMEVLIRRAFAYADGHISFFFQGGEPTLAGSDFYNRWLALERKYNSRLLSVSHAIQTNGYALDSELIDVFRRGGFLVGVSLDGTQKIHDKNRPDSSGHGTYHLVCESIQKLRSARIPYNILTVVNETVAKEPTAVFQALAPHGYLQFIPCLDALDGQLRDDSLTESSFASFLMRTFDLYEAAWRSGRYVSIRHFDNWIRMSRGEAPELCSMNGHCSLGFTVESDGRVYPCDFFALDSYCLGSIMNDSFIRLIKSSQAATFLREGAVTHPDCRSCSGYLLCRGGCRRERNPETGRLRLCNAYRRFFGLYASRIHALSMLTPENQPYITEF